MIQRIQSVFLLIASLCLMGLYKLPFGASKLPLADSIFSDSVFNMADNNILKVVIPVGAALFLIAIFLFRNRNIQSLLTFAGAVATGMVVGIAGAEIYESSKILTEDNGFIWKAGLALPIVSAILAILASRAIKKDENLVKSMDRLR